MAKLLLARSTGSYFVTHLFSSSMFSFMSFSADIVDGDACGVAWGCSDIGCGFGTCARSGIDRFCIVGVILVNVPYTRHHSADASCASTFWCSSDSSRARLALTGRNIQQRSASVGWFHVNGSILFIQAGDR